MPTVLAIIENSVLLPHEFSPLLHELSPLVVGRHSFGPKVFASIVFLSVKFSG